jgi:hypothetical protein
MIEQIAERWSKATPGPWVPSEQDDVCAITTAYEQLWDDSQSVPTVGDIVKPWYGVVTEEDAAAIASAPTDIATLLRIARAAEDVLNEFDEFGHRYDGARAFVVLRALRVALKGDGDK